MKGAGQKVTCFRPATLCSGLGPGILSNAGGVGWGGWGCVCAALSV